MEQIIEKCTGQVIEIYEQFDASHDFDHILRVMRNAEAIAGTLPEANMAIVRLAALLHDVDDPKYKMVNHITALDLLQSSGVDDETTFRVLETIKSVSFNGGNEEEIVSIEGAILRDADRLDAIGAIGIARTFAFGGARGRKLYDADEIVRTTMSESEYRSKNTSSVTHFYEKLLLLKDLMVTEEGTRLAEERHVFMLDFLEQLKREVGI
ncbi:HD domain-containing protein [Sporosarcina highlanderae]|uniref:HD domain-containing protein n=1 Tax=Sporosarcina highlanderae TaxID=3035916 RepID=A0ABT8JU51_9BACL|nr:HD domain-containing protein [Sporosarcina highlanderae]MDN4608691.1 HD domain-containing protein [Sporosarcina highlanderae]